jgi:hypothetical protein
MAHENGYSSFFEILESWRISFNTNRQDRQGHNEPQL